MTGRAGGDGAPAGTAMSGERRAISIDPRIRQRRIEVRREEGRRRLRFLIGVVVVLLLAGSAAAATRSPLLDVDHIHVTGNRHATDGRLLSAGRLAKGVLMIEVDTGAVERGMESLRWVASARVSREWPSTVRVEVVERTAVAAVAVADGRWAPVDRHGRVLEPVPERPALPALAGVLPLDPARRTTPTSARPALAVVAAMRGPLTTAVAGVAPTSSGLDLQLHGGGVVRFGAPTEVEAKLAALGAVLERVDPTTVAVIDVRVPDAPVLTRR